MAEEALPDAELEAAPSGEDAEPQEPLEEFETYLERTPHHKSRYEETLAEREESGKQLGRNEGFQSAQGLKEAFDGRGKSLTEARAAWDQLAAVFNEATEAGVVDTRLKREIMRLVPSLGRMELLNQEALQQGVEEKAAPIAQKAHEQGVNEGYNMAYWHAVQDIFEAIDGGKGQFDKLVKAIGPQVPWEERRKLVAKAGKDMVDSAHKSGLAEGGKLDTEKAKIAARAGLGPELGGTSAKRRSDDDLLGDPRTPIETVRAILERQGVRV